MRLPGPAAILRAYRGERQCLRSVPSWLILSLTETIVSTDMYSPGNRLEAAVEHAQKRLVMWFAGIMVVHALAVVALTVGLVKLL